MTKKILLFVFALVSSAMSYADVCDMAMNDVTCQAGETATLSLSFTGSCRAFQSDLVLPEGVSIVETGNAAQILEGKLFQEKSGGEKIWQTLGYNAQSDGSMRIASYASQNNSAAGVICTVELAVASSVAPGTYSLSLKNCECAQGGTIVSSAKEATATLTVTRSASGINDVTITDDADAAIYNLAGQRVGKTAKGIVIKNGKKCVVK